MDLVSGYDAPNAADGAGVTTYGYNLAKQLTSVTRPDGVVVSYLYEGDAGLAAPNPNTGRLKTIVQPRGNTVFGYDTAGRLSNITAPDGGRLAYGYDGNLLLSTTWSNGAVNGTVSRTYDDYAFIDPQNGAYLMTSNFFVKTESVNGGDTVTFENDNDGRLYGAHTQQATFYIYNNTQNGLTYKTELKDRATGNQVVDNISYNGFAEPIGYGVTCSGTATHCGSTPFYNVSYVRDAVGRIASKTETVNGVITNFDYHYDIAGRLTGVDKNGVPSSSYTYDSNGNRLSYSGDMGNFTGTYDAQERLLSYGAFAYEYTANGDLKKKTNTLTGEVWEYDFDEYGNLLRAMLPDGMLVEYVIDGRSRRVGKKVNGVLTGGFLYGNRLRVVAELDSTNTVLSRFVYGDRVNVPEIIIKGGVTYRILLDQVGSVRMVVDTATGIVAQQIDYDEFGNISNDTNPQFQPFGFAGGLYDRSTGFVRFGARDLDPMVARWTTKDPLLFDGGTFNLYQYADNDPINLVDPWGTVAYTDKELNCLIGCDKDRGYCLFSKYKDPCQQNQCADELDKCRDTCTPKEKVRTPRRKGCDPKIASCLDDSQGV